MGLEQYLFEQTVWTRLALLNIIWRFDTELLASLRASWLWRFMSQT